MVGRRPYGSLATHTPRISTLPHTPTHVLAVQRHLLQPRHTQPSRVVPTPYRPNPACLCSATCCNLVISSISCSTPSRAFTISTRSPSSR